MMIFRRIGSTTVAMLAISSACFEGAPFQSDEGSSGSMGGEETDSVAGTSSASSSSGLPPGTGSTGDSGATTTATSSADTFDSDEAEGAEWTSDSMAEESETETSNSSSTTGSDSSDDTHSDSASDTNSDNGETSDSSETSASSEEGSDSSDSSSDPKCEGAYRCAPEAPAGWEGPVARIVGPNGTASPSCQGQFPTPELQAFEAVQAGPKVCPQCGCDEPKGGSCAPGEIHAYRGIDLQCETRCEEFCFEETVEFDSETYCANVEINSNDRAWDAVVIEEPVFTPGSCSTNKSGSESTPMVTKISPQSLCSTSAVAAYCEADELCLPRPSAPFEGQYCIWREGTHDCPEDEYHPIQALFSSYVDSRECGDCRCGPVTGPGRCDFDAWQFYEPGCSGDKKTFIHRPKDCSTLTEEPELFLMDVSILIEYTRIFEGNGCESSGGASLGKVSPDDETTVCCMSI